MNRFFNELRVIPRAAWVVGFLLYLLCAIVLTGVFFFAHDPDMAQMPFLAKTLLPIFGPLPLFIPVLLFGYVNGDAKRRGMRHVMWTLLAIFIPNAIGIILYFVLREPLPRPCPRCNTMVKPAFAFCPQCGSEIQKACPSCRRPVEVGWANCAYCGMKVSSQQKTAV
jgi:RNA polymerase subunit RPABC4/transcription elongation factor Spt4